MPAHLDLSPYRLPLRRPWASARGGFPERCGWLVTAGAQRLRGYGDCAPLPAAGTETPAAALQRLRAVAGNAATAPLAHPDAIPGTTPAADYALDCALSDLASRRVGETLRRHLAPTPLDQVPVNAVLGALLDTRPADLARAARQGFRVAKLKAGLAAPELELAHLRHLCATLAPGLRLRLDANGAWDPGVAARFIAALAALPGESPPVESLEEPLRTPDWPTLAALQDRAPFPLALDESVAHTAVTLDPARFPVRRIVLKPAALGGLRRALDTARRFQAAGIQVVITSLVESAAGLWPTAQLAAALGSPIPQGLATADWLAADLGTPPAIRDGHLLLPSTPGSGFTPHGLDTDGGV